MTLSDHVLTTTAAPATATASASAGSRYAFARQFIRLAGPYWHSEEKWKVRGLTIALFLLTVTQVGLSIWTNYWSRGLFDALEARSLPRFLLQIGTFVIIFMLTISVTAVHLHVKRWLQLGWREWLTQRLLNRWMAHGHHYQLGFMPGEHDNPDGRIADDIRKLTETGIALAHTLVYSLLIFSTFVNILLMVSGDTNVPGTSFVIPGYMVVMAFIYAGVGTGFGVLFGRPLVNTTNKLQTAEANFRFGLARERANSEAIALIHGENVERQQSTRLFGDIKWFWNRQSFAYMGLVSFSSGYGALLPVFPILIAAPQYIAGVFTLGVLMQSAQAFEKLTSALSWPIDHLGEMAECRASADRVLSLYDDLQKMEERAAVPDDCHIVLGQSSKAELIIKDLCIANLEGRILIENFNLEVQRGERLLITGDPSVAVSLFKVVAGLWPWGQGQVLLPHDHTIAFMPQRPYIPAGTLRAALSYPAPSETYDTRAMEYALECAGLAWLTPRLDENDIWDQVLPVRVQQRLGFARVFLQQPHWIFIEEASDAFDPRGEDHMLEMLISELPNAALLTICFHPGLEHHHARTLVLDRVQEEKYLFKPGAVCELA